MRKPGPLSEIAALLLWGASAVKVFGYTWTAYMGTRIPFPTLGGGENTPVGAPPPILKKLPIIGPALPDFSKRKGESFGNWLKRMLIGWK